MVAFRLWFTTKHKNLLLRNKDQETFSELASQIDINDRGLFLKAAEQHKDNKTTDKIK